MNRQKLISVLQSRIAKRKDYLGTAWQLYSEIKAREEHYQAHHWKVAVNNVGKLQKEDKQILKQLVEDEREIKKWKKAFAEADLILWELQQREW